MVRATTVYRKDGFLHEHCEDFLWQTALRLLTCFHKKTLLGKTSFSPMEKYILPNSVAVT